MASETWRVELRDGSVREVVPIEAVPQADRSVKWTCAGAGYHTSQARAVLMWAFGQGGDLAEILAPGEPTRAEAVAAERERCARLCDEVAAGDDSDIIRSADGEFFARGETRGAQKCAAKIRAGGV